MRRLLPLLLLLAVTVVGTAGGAVAAPAPGPATASEVHPEWGIVSAPDARLHRGCRGYAYSYALTPPDGDWALETFLVGPHGRVHGSGYFDTGADPLAGPARWRLCLRATRPGTYTIRARLSVDDVIEQHDGWLPETTFRLRPPRR